ncbi:STAS domain-containing protein [Herbiconiux sp.]|uniref:STAS domain-containing protein n=1 Tax=Herbiconiux sp. TaxID=1871186 RepID=UPI0025B7EE1A|nr:STAS domain-containing protein [Herbiconiux sp.]
MEFQTESIGDDIVVIRGDGRLNMVSGPALRETVTRAVEGGRARVVVDLSRIPFMDSSGLGALIAGLKTAREKGGDLRIVQPSTQVAMVLKLSNVDKILPAFDSTEEAYGD